MTLLRASQSPDEQTLGCASWGGGLPIWPLTTQPGFQTLWPHMTQGTTEPVGWSSGHTHKVHTAHIAVEAQTWGDRGRQPLPCELPAHPRRQPELAAPGCMAGHGGYVAPRLSLHVYGPTLLPDDSRPGLKGPGGSPPKQTQTRDDKCSRPPVCQDSWPVTKQLGLGWG